MERTIAFVVGIETYAHAGAPELLAPCLDAARVALRLHAMGVPPQNIHVRLQPRQRAEAEQQAFAALLAQLDAAGVEVEHDCTHANVDTFWRDRLITLQGQTPEGRLFVYWSGHGFTESVTGVPYLLCSECTDALATRVVNRRELLGCLHADDYQNLRAQLFFVDACANNLAWKGLPGTTALPWNGGIDQLSFAAAARDRYAHGDSEGGLFTRVLLAALDDGIDWGQLDAFRDGFHQRLLKASFKDTLVAHDRGTGAHDSWHLRATSPALEDLNRRLGNLALAPSRYLPLYQLVLSSLSSEARRGKADSVDAIVRDLWNANGQAAAATAPYPVVELVLRVRQAFPAADSLDEWLGTTGYVRPADLARAQGRLQEEENALFLVVELIESTSEKRTGEHVELRTRLFRFDRATTMPSWPDAEPQPVSSWDDMVAKLRPLVAGARALAAQHDASLTVEFLTNLFDIDPHLIVLEEQLGEPVLLGEQHPVVLRWRGRAPGRDDQRPWRARAADIRRGTVATCVHPVDATEPSLQPCRMVLVRHPLAKDSGPRHGKPASEEWKVALRAIRAGEPFLCLPLEGPGAAGWDGIESKVKDWFRDGTRLDDVPARVQEGRAAGGVAAKLNLFWDDPLTTWQLREIRMGQ